MFALVNRLYRVASPTGDDDTPFKLDAGTRDELLALAILAPCVCSLRAEPLDRIFCTDASPEAGGICESELSPDLTRAVHRLTDRRGFRSQLLRRGAALLAERGRLTPPELDEEGDDEYGYYDEEE